MEQVHRWPWADGGWRNEILCLNFKMQLLASLGRDCLCLSKQNSAWLHSGISAGVSTPCWTACHFDILHCSQFYNSFTSWRLREGHYPFISCWFKQSQWNVMILDGKTNAVMNKAAGEWGAQVEKYCKNNMKWWVLVIMALNKEYFSRQISKIRYDRMHCWKNK